MLKALVIGDVHARVEDLADCDRLAALVYRTEAWEKPDLVVLLGDLYDSFALKNVQVERWWMSFLDGMATPAAQRYLLVGNHDRPGDSSQLAHALQVHRGQGNVVEGPTQGPDGLGFLPFYFRSEQFVEAAKDQAVSGCGTLFCHQSFIGGRYESGQPIDARHDASAADPEVLPQRCVVAGHIHTPQSTGKVFYPGAPRWRDNVSDANVDRYVYAMEFDGGAPSACRKYPTGGECRRVWKVDVTPEGTSLPQERGKDGDRWVVDVTGPAAFIEQAKKGWSAPGTRLRLFQTDRPGPKLSEAQGVGAAWSRWLGEYEPRYGTGRGRLSELARERVQL